MNRMAVAITAWLWKQHVISEEDRELYEYADGCYAVVGNGKPSVKNKSKTAFCPKEAGKCHFM